MTLFKPRTDTECADTGRILLIALGVLACAASGAQSAPDPQAAATDSTIAAPGGAEAAEANSAEANTTAQTPTGSAQVEQSAPPAVDEGGRSKAGVRTRKLAIGGLSIPTKAKPVRAPKAKRVSPYHGMEETAKSRQFYSGAWGVDKLRAHYTSSGNLIRFTFRVLQPKLAKPLGDHESSPYMFAPRAHAVLQVPTMEKVGQLRQLGNLEPQKEYWMVFSNKGNLVHPGDRVDVIIGKFHADGLLVE
jgi:hypothetical protein